MLRQVPQVKESLEAIGNPTKKPVLKERHLTANFCFTSQVILQTVFKFFPDFSHLPPMKRYYSELNSPTHYEFRSAQSASHLTNMVRDTNQQRFREMKKSFTELPDDSDWGERKRQGSNLPWWEISLSCLFSIHTIQYLFGSPAFLTSTFAFRCGVWGVFLLFLPVAEVDAAACLWNCWDCGHLLLSAALICDVTVRWHHAGILVSLWIMPAICQII